MQETKVTKLNILIIFLATATISTENLSKLKASLKLYYYITQSVHASPAPPLGMTSFGSIPNLMM